MAAADRATEKPYAQVTLGSEEAGKRPEEFRRQTQRRLVEMGVAGKAKLMESVLDTLGA